MTYVAPVLDLRRTMKKTTAIQTISRKIVVNMLALTGISHKPIATNRGPSTGIAVIHIT